MKTENKLELHYRKILGEPKPGDLEDLERKFSEKAQSFRNTKESDGFHLSAVQENGEILTAYNYLKTLWSLPSEKNKGFKQEINTAPAPKSYSIIENAHRRLHLFAKSALALVLITASFQFLVLSLGIPSIRSESESQELILAKAIKEELALQPLRKKKELEPHLREVTSELVSKSQPALIKAARNCNASQLKEILAGTDATANITNNKLETALHWTARRNCLNGAKILLANNANPHSMDKAGRTPIDWAESSNNINMLRLLKYKR